MKKQSILATLLFLILAIAPSMFAQKKGGAAKASGRADARLAELTTQLSLTDDEKAKIKPIIDDETSKIHVIKMDKALSDDDKKAKTKPIRSDSDKQIRAILTPEQAKAFDALPKKEGGEKKGGKKKEAAAPAPTA